MTDITCEVRLNVWTPSIPYAIESSYFQILIFYIDGQIIVLN